MAETSADRLAAISRAARTKIRAIGILILLGTSVSVFAALILPRHWTATASFFPGTRSTSDLAAGLGSLAGLVGAAGGSLGFGQSSSQFFADLVKSRSFLDSLAMSSIIVDTPSETLRVEDYVVPHARSAADRRWRARAALRKAIRVSTLPSGVVVMSVTSKSPRASAALANRAIEVIDKLNIDFRRREAIARRRFTQQFLQDVQGRLTEAEDRLENFLATNRTFVTPALMRKQQSYQLEVERLRILKQQLESNIENTRLSEYNDAPVVATVDEASVPERPSGPPRRVIVVGGFMTTLAAIFWALYLRLWK